MDFPLGEHIGNANEIYECILSFNMNSAYGESVKRLTFKSNVPGFTDLEGGV
jgi:thymidine phosphorylase